MQKGDFIEDLALLHHQHLTELKMRQLGDRMSRCTAWRIAREQGWETTYDAEYPAVAEFQADANPALVLKARGVVPFANVDALTAT